ncbi:hypothetical protein [Mesorhizobium sp. M0217]|uniref:hypothetical protein n=1 Tax=unclassified Mesorhizobium TaxID=325217 RepID=UPI003339C1C8
MLTLESILKATRQMTSYGEHGTAGALDHLPARVQGPRERKRTAGSNSAGSDISKPTGTSKPARRWDDELKIFRHD